MTSLFRHFFTKNLTILLMLVWSANGLQIASAQAPQPLVHDTALGVTSAVAITADGRTHQYRLELTNPNFPNPPEPKDFKVNGQIKTYYKASDGNWYPPGNPTWNFARGNDGHPDWGQSGQKKIKEKDFFEGFEVSTKNPTLSLSALGYELSIKGRRIKGGTGNGPPGLAGEATEEDWGSSFTNQSIDEITSSFDVEITNPDGSKTKRIFVTGSADIKGTATGGQKVDPTGQDTRPYYYTYEVKVQGPNGDIILRPRKPNPSDDVTGGMIKKDTLATWNTEELKPDKTRKYPPGTYTITHSVFAETGGAGGTATATAIVFTVEIVSPTPPTKVNNVDKIMTPATAANNNTGNEFTYSSTNPGVLTVPIRVSILPDTADVHAAFQDKVRVKMDAISDSHANTSTYVNLAWTPGVFAGESKAGNGVYNAGSQSWQATATFTGLPPMNTDFGQKAVTAEVLRDGNSIVTKQRQIEIFFPRDQTNHPDLPGKPDLGNFSANAVDTTNRGNSTRSRNWFFYWIQTPAGTAGTAEFRYDSTLAAAFFGQTPAIFNWRLYEGVRERVSISALSITKDTRLDGSNQIVTGIDLFRTTLLHEARHVRQVIDHNRLNPYNVSVGRARIGWSFSDGGVPLQRTRANITAGLYNHFTAGPDGRPGRAGVDDDGDGLIDERDEFIAGLGDTTVGDDTDLDPDGDRINVGDPHPNVAEPLVEPQAEAAETNLQDGMREHDWGNPGKRHGPDLAAFNADGEINAYND